jgi:hypothetical protein
MSKFENILNTLWEEIGGAPPNGMPTTSSGTPTTAPAPTANNTVTGAPNPANANNPTNQQQPKPGTPNNTNQPVTDPNHPIVNALAGAKTPQDVLTALQKNNIQLIPVVKK